MPDRKPDNKNVIFKRPKQLKPRNVHKIAAFPK